jgi:DNA adenine methylase
MGRYKNPNVVQEERLQLASQALQKVELRAQTFDKVARKAKAGDLVYFDPPYQPLNATSSFTSYTQEPFGPEQQWKLAQLFGELVSRGCHVFLSNSDTPLIRELYADFECLEVQATRMINSKSDRRQAIGEVFVVGKPK